MVSDGPQANSALRLVLSYDDNNIDGNSYRQHSFFQIALI